MINNSYLFLSIARHLQLMAVPIDFLILYNHNKVIFLCLLYCVVTLKFYRFFRNNHFCKLYLIMITFFCIFCHLLNNIKLFKQNKKYKVIGKKTRMKISTSSEDGHFKFKSSLVTKNPTFTIIHSYETSFNFSEIVWHNKIQI